MDDQIHEEWIRNVLKDRPDLTEQQLTRTRQLMDEAVPDSLVTGYEPLIDNLKLPDVDDRHVLAAAIRAKAEVIVTFNRKDFPADTLAEFDIFTQHPDDFVDSLYDISPVYGELLFRQQRVAEIVLGNEMTTGNC